MGNTKSSKSNLNSVFALVLIAAAVLVANTIFYTIMQGHTTVVNGVREPLHDDILGKMYMGGFIVPFLMSFFMIVIGVAIERGIALLSANGKKSLSTFVASVKAKLSANDIDGAIAECNEQGGSVGNVTYEVLNRYKAVAGDTGLSKDKKLDALQKEVEEATMLELPALEKNLTIVATLASVSTLFALLGTVIGMIKAFSALATTGSPDPAALSNGISEALINTALGIFTSALAIVAYNFFTSKVDDLTHKIDEVGFAVRQHFIATGR
ncbi:MAG TPA: MotA/TolQ/ExbB proton channel family protein [Cytophagaceae bacterium]|jgi:biopolymer transport protein ExbB|nr:MotA/TolQ/ExbB proton channel family protein [Cytophagaceae bacterium]